MAHLEKQFHDLFVEKGGSLLKNCELIDHEVPLVNAHSVLTRDFQLNRVSAKTWGRIDFVIKWKSNIWVVELKFPHASKPDFWDATKVVAYTAYYNWQMNAHAKSAIMMPKQHYTLEHRITATKMGLQLLGIEGKGDNMKVIPIE